MDAGVLYHLAGDRKEFDRIDLRNLALGFSVSNILQPKIKLFQMEDEPARVFRPSLSYFYEFPGSADTLWVAAEGEFTENGGTLLKTGFEYGWNKTVFGRMGYDGAGLTLGAGLRIRGLQVDYALNQRDLGSLHLVSLSYRFGRYQENGSSQKISLLRSVARGYAVTREYGLAIKAWEKVLAELPGDEEASLAVKTLEKRRKAEIQNRLEAARTAMAQKDWEKSIPLIAGVLGLEPGNAEAQGLLRQIDRQTMLSTNYLRGIEAFSGEDYPMAVQYLGMVYKVDPHYREVSSFYHDAEGHFKPLETLPKEGAAMYARGVDYYMNGDYPKAIKAWEEVLRENPGNFLVRRNIEEARKRLREKPPAGNSPAPGDRP